MNQVQLERVDRLKAAISEVNKVVTEFNQDNSNPLKVKIYQQEFDGQMNSRAVKNAVKYVACEVSETFIY